MMPVAQAFASTSACPGKKLEPIVGWQKDLQRERGTFVPRMQALMLRMPLGGKPVPTFPGHAVFAHVLVGNRFPLFRDMR
jgi:hypothetical protein